MAIELTQDVVHISPRFRLRISVGKLQKSRQKGDDFSNEPCWDSVKFFRFPVSAAPFKTLQFVHFFKLYVETNQYLSIGVYNLYKIKRGDNSAIKRLLRPPPPPP